MVVHFIKCFRKIKRTETDSGANNNNDFQQAYTFVPLAFETLEPINVKGVEFLQELGRRLIDICSDDNRQTSFLFQRISITLQRFNAITFADTFA